MRRCDFCGYDLRGIRSERCPECGVSLARLSIPVHDPRQFHDAVAALREANLLLKAVQPGGSIGTVGILYGAMLQPGWIVLDTHRLDEIEPILDRFGISAAVPGGPLVDRAEPVCPSCSVELDPDAPPQCAKCGALFQWIEIEADEPALTADELRRRHLNHGQPGRGSLLLLFVFLCILAFPAALLASFIDGVGSTEAIIIAVTGPGLLTAIFGSWRRAKNRSV